jgi:hypothetical protein
MGNIQTRDMKLIIEEFEEISTYEYCGPCGRMKHFIKGECVKCSMDVI